MSVKEPVSRRVQSVDRAVGLLRAVAEAPGAASLADLAERVGLNRSTAWRLLLTLEHHGLVDRDAATGGFVLGYEVGRLALRGGRAGLVRRARPALSELAEQTGMTAVLSVPTATEPIAVDQVDSPGRPEPNMVGWGLSLHATAAGKVWLAFLEQSDREEILRRPLARFTASTVTDARALRRELDEVRRTSLAVEHDQWDDGWAAIATPVIEGGAVVAIPATSR
jgi:IclR family transcriptional regulator, acetate operon repressor